MRRHVIILLLFAMPLQSAWAAAAADAQPAHPNDGNACPLLAASAVLSSQPNLPLPKGAPHMRGETRRYV